MVLKDDVARWQKQKGMGICSGDAESDSFTNLRFAVDVLLFSTSQVQLQKMLCDCNQSTRDGRIERPPGQDENPQQPTLKQQKWR